MDDLIRLAQLLDLEETHPDSVDDPFIAVATVVGTVGSAYRRPGARILIRASGETVGSISAGCLESDVVAHCEDLTEPKLLTYDGAAAQEAVFGLQLGCAGLIQILLEPLRSKHHAAHLLNKETRAVLEQPGEKIAVTLFESEPGNCQPQSKGPSLPPGLTLVKSKHACVASPHLTSELRTQLLGECESSMREQRSKIVKLSARMNALVEHIKSVPSILIFGSGPDTESFLALADTLGWHVTVADVKLARTKRAYGNARIVKVDIEAPLEELDLEHIDAVIVMSHDYNRDRIYLQSVLRHRVPYVSIMGPRNRTEKLLAEIESAAKPISAERKASLKTPAGLNIGAERPEEIALSILAEIKAVLMMRPGGFLSDCAGAIHEPVKTLVEPITVFEVTLPQSTLCKLS